MKTKLWALAAIGISYLAFYLYQKNKAAKNSLQPAKEKERHHLTNVFAKAKHLAVGNQ